MALMPCYFVCVVAFELIPQQYVATPLKMTVICFLLSLITGAAMDISPIGAPNGIVAVLVFSVLWAMLLVLINFFMKIICVTKNSKWFRNTKIFSAFNKRLFNSEKHTHNKALKAFASLTGTVQTGAASHCRAGSSCPLAWR
jgi:hypothetical protein